MTEQDNNELTQAEQLSQEFLQFIQGAEFGTPEYWAISDAFDMRDLENKKARFEGTAQVEISIGIALLDHTIRQNKSRVEGYSSAFEYFEDTCDNLATTVAGEANEVYPDNGTDQESYFDKIYDSTLMEAREIVESKRK